MVPGTLLTRAPGSVMLYKRWPRPRWCPRPNSWWSFFGRWRVGCCCALLLLRWCYLCCCCYMAVLCCSNFLVLFGWLLTVDLFVAVHWLMRRNKSETAGKCEQQLWIITATIDERITERSMISYTGETSSTIQVHTWCAYGAFGLELEPGPSNTRQRAQAVVARAAYYAFLAGDPKTNPPFYPVGWWCHASCKTIKLQSEL